MYLSALTIDDLLRRVYGKLLVSKNRVAPTRGNTLELTGVLLCLRNPRARISRTEMRGKIFSCLGELFWYLSKSNDVKHIAYYLPRYIDDSDDGKTIYGGYGPRLFDFGGIDQIDSVLSLLKTRPGSRRAVIQLFGAADLMGTHIEIPCTCTLQFMVRKERLHMFTHMRSNDAFKGLPHDVFAFTMLQELIARSLGVEMGEYKHFIGSLHIYENDIPAADAFMAEDWQSSVEMPRMPAGDPWASVLKVLTAERKLRNNKDLIESDYAIDPYWADLIRLLQIFRHSKNKNQPAIAATKRKMSTTVYNMYISRRQTTKTTTAPKQLLLVDSSLAPL